MSSHTVFSSDRASRHPAARLDAGAQHRERHAAEVEHDVVRLALKARLGAVEVADHGGGGGAPGREQVGVGMCGRPGRHGGAVLGRAERLCARFDRRVWRGRLQCRVGRGGHTLRGQLVGREFRWKLFPGQLFCDGVGACQRHGAPVVDGAGGAGRNAGHAGVAHIGPHDIVVVVVRDGAHGAGGLAGVAADADLRVDQVLPDQGGCHCHVHGVLRRVRVRGLSQNARIRNPRAGG